DEARNDYATAKEYHIHNTIGVTPFTQSKIKAAQDAYAQGVSDRNSWMSYLTSFFRYRTKK
ncbi:MAG TPA: hypothetical protein VL201_02285, partial [Patescibacteria group bacterium]|nr:hypothetical protein [Patescibacteria group bacterium]